MENLTTDTDYQSRFEKHVRGVISQAQFEQHVRDTFLNYCVTAYENSKRSVILEEIVRCVKMRVDVYTKAAYKSAVALGQLPYEKQPDVKTSLYASVFSNATGIVILVKYVHQQKTHFVPWRITEKTDWIHFDSINYDAKCGEWRDSV